MAGVELSVKSGLDKLIQDLDKLRGHAETMKRDFKTAGDEVSEALQNSTKKTEEKVQNSRNIMRRALDQLKGDLKSLFSLHAVTEGFKLSSQFKGSIGETVTLSDTIRKFGSILGIAQRDFVKFQTAITKGMGDIGLSSESAANALAGLAETPVKGEQALTEYAKLAGTLAQISGQKGQEGNIGKGIARVIQAKGGNVNDVGQAKAVSEDVLRARGATGKGAAEILQTMEDLFTGMSQDLRKKIGTKGLAQVAAIAQVGGPNATKFFQQFTNLSKTQRAGLEARGIGNIVTEKGINVDALRRFAEEAKKLGGGDFRLGVKAMGVEGDEAAEGFIRLAENLEQVKKTADDFNSSQIDMNKQLRDSMGLADAFKASINKIKSTVSGPLSAATQGLTEMLSDASKSTGGAAAVAAGGAGLAAVLAGYGLRGAGKGLLGGALGGFAKGAAAEAITGKEVQPVYVTNASEISGGVSGALSGASGAAAGVLGTVGKAAGVVGAGAAGYEVGSQVINPVLDKATQGKTSEGFEGNVVERLFFKLDMLLGGETSGRFMAGQAAMKPQEVSVKFNDQTLTTSKQPSRGAAH